MKRLVKSVVVFSQFPPEFDTGDAHKVKMRLPNHVYNKLKIHSVKEKKRAARLHEKKEHSTAVSTGFTQV